MQDSRLFGNPVAGSVTGLCLANSPQSKITPTAGGTFGADLPAQQMISLDLHHYNRNIIVGLGLAHVCG